ncbi:hypothetical protein PvNV_060 [Penaeus vannamei nudivirus]|nr:hypothetical protein PvSNPV_060 [Penaeus vannamei nucleopolyhedrovirus]
MSFTVPYKEFRIAGLSETGMLDLLLPTVNLNNKELRHLTLFGGDYTPMPGPSLMKSRDVFQKYKANLYADMTTCNRDELNANSNAATFRGGNIVDAFLKSSDESGTVYYMGNCPSQEERDRVSKEMEIDDIDYNQAKLNITKLADKQNLPVVDSNSQNPGYTFISSYNDHFEDAGNFGLLAKIIYLKRSVTYAMIQFSETMPTRIKTYLNERYKELTEKNSKNSGTIYQDNEKLLNEIKESLNTISAMNEMEDLNDMPAAAVLEGMDVQSSENNTNVTILDMQGVGNFNESSI